VGLGVLLVVPGVVVIGAKKVEPKGSIFQVNEEIVKVAILLK